MDNVGYGCLACSHCVIAASSPPPPNTLQRPSALYTERRRWCGRIVMDPGVNLVIEVRCGRHCRPGHKPDKDSLLDLATWLAGTRENCWTHPYESGRLAFGYKEAPLYTQLSRHYTQEQTKWRRRSKKRHAPKECGGCPPPARKQSQQTTRPTYHIRCTPYLSACVFSQHRLCLPVSS